MSTPNCDSPPSFHANGVSAVPSPNGRQAFSPPPEKKKEADLQTGKRAWFSFSKRTSKSKDVPKNSKFAHKQPTMASKYPDLHDLGDDHDDVLKASSRAIQDRVTLLEQYMTRAADFDRIVVAKIQRNEEFNTFEVRQAYSIIKVLQKLSDKIEDVTCEAQRGMDAQARAAMNKASEKYANHAYSLELVISYLEDMEGATAQQSQASGTPTAQAAAQQPAPPPYQPQAGPMPSKVPPPRPQQPPHRPAPPPPNQQHQSHHQQVPNQPGTAPSAPPAGVPMYYVNPGFSRPPEIKVGVFSGQSVDWPHFRTLFMKLIGERADMDNYQKLSHFKNAMPERFQKIIEGYIPDEYTFARAVQMVDEDMQIRDTDTSRHLRSYRKLARPTSDDPTSLQTFRAEVLRITESFERETTFRRNVAHDADMVMTTLQAKLTHGLRQEWAQYLIGRMNYPESHLEKFLWFLKDRSAVSSFTRMDEEEAKLQQMMMKTYVSTPRPKGPRQASKAQQPPKKPVVKQENVLATQITRQQSGRRSMRKTKTYSPKPQYKAYDPLPCTFCRGDHPPRSCKKTLGPEAWQKLIDDHVCFSCLKKGHWGDACDEKTQCMVGRDCPYSHHPMMHGVPGFPKKPQMHRAPAQNTSSREKKMKGKKNSKEADSHYVHTDVDCYHVDADAFTNTIEEGGKPMLPVVDIPTGSGKSSKKMLAMLDTGSTHSFVSENVLPHLTSVETLEDPIFLTINKLNKSVEKVPTRLVRFPLHCKNATIWFDAYVMKQVSFHSSRKLPAHVIEKLKVEEMNHLGGYVRPVDFLIGITDLFKVCTGSLVRLSTQFCLMGTIWGYIPTGNPLTVVKDNSDCHATVSTETLSKQVEMTWQMENLDLLLNKSDKPMTMDEQFAIEQLKNSVEYDAKNKRYTVGLIFKPGPRNIQNNYSTALARLNGLMRKLKKQPQVLDAYLKEFRELLDRNVYQEISDENAEHPSREIYYLPHREVYDENKSGHKCRFVVDASSPCKSTGKSLNDALLPGPPLISSIVNMHLRLRQKPIVLIGDISRMFHQVLVREKDKDYLRLLFKFPNEDKVRIYRANTIQFGCIDSPMICMYILHTHCQKAIDDKNTPARIKAAARAILDHSYVDDIAVPVDTEKEAIDLRKAMDELLEPASFTIKKWVTNNCNVLQSIPEDLRAPTIGNYSAPTKILGTNWDPKSDSYAIADFAASIEDDVTPTKRSVLALSAKINFDPLGYTQPFVLMARLILQDCFRNKLTWDQPLPVKTKDSWTFWKEHAKDLKTITLPRYTPTKDAEIHVFGDASGYAFGCVAYIRYKTSKNKFDTIFLMSRSRAAPLKMKPTIPNLEMSAAYETAKLAHLLQTEYKLPSEKIHCYTDSSCVFFWCRKNIGHLTPFVGNRVKRIQELKLTFNYIHTSENPADISSKGARPCFLVSSDLWNKGPKFLRKHRQHWPSLLPPSDLPADLQTGLRKQVSPQVLNTEKIFNPEIYLKRFDNFSQFLRVNGLLYKYMYKTKVLDFQAIRHITNVWIKMVQKYEWTETVQNLTSKNPCPRNSPLLPLNPFLDKTSLMRAGGRLSQSDQLNFNEKFPILIPPQSTFTKLLLDHLHKIHGHPNADWLFSLVRRKYWIPKGRRTITKASKSCVRCARVNAKPAGQIMADLPEERTNFTQVWDTLGIDVAGPILLKPSYMSRSKTRVKGYILVFTDLASRCVHLELMTDVSTSSIIKAIKRCGARKGFPRKIISDNMTGFIRSEKELKQMLLREEQDLKSQAAELQIEWQFVPPYTPHQNGITERVVYQVKHCLRKIVRNMVMTPIEATQLCCDIEAHLNSRPLYKPSYDLDAEDALTPIHLLLGRPLQTWPVDLESHLPMTPSVKDQWDNRSKLLKSFLKKWHREYLPTLQRRGKWQSTKPDLQKGTFVLVKDPGVGSLKKQYMWPIGVITDVKVGRDGKVRTVEIKTKKGLETRSAVHCYPLECFDHDPRFQKDATPDESDLKQLRQKQQTEQQADQDPQEPLGQNEEVKPKDN